jgi:molybdenum-dependent DNA-binding transcriptional regulator ModE
MLVAVVGGRMAGYATLVDVRVRVLHTIMGMGMDVEVALEPTEEDSESESDDDQADGYLSTPHQPFR